MKKFILSVLLLVSIYLFLPTKSFAVNSTDIQNMINTSIAPLQSSITSLQGAVSSLQSAVAILQSNVGSILTRLSTNEVLVATDGAKLAVHETRISSLENNAVSDFNLPASWVATVSASTISVKGTKGVVSLSCSWNGLLLGQQVQVRGIAHLPTNDYYAVGNCDSGIAFTGVTNFPVSGSVIPVDLWAFWQGKTKQVTIPVSMP